MIIYLIPKYIIFTTNKTNSIRFFSTKLKLIDYNTL